MNPKGFTGMSGSLLFFRYLSFIESGNLKIRIHPEYHLTYHFKDHKYRKH